MVIEIDKEWAYLKQKPEYIEIRAWCKEHYHLDQLIFYSRME